jgi:hypothetical protein
VWGGWEYPRRRMRKAHMARKKQRNGTRFARLISCRG